MNVIRSAPQRIRDTYQRTRNALPTPTPPAPVAVTAEAVTVLGRAWISARPLLLGTHTDAPHLWIVCNDPGDPTVLGHYTGLSTGDPQLTVTDPSHRPWLDAGDNTAHLTRAAVRVWTQCLHTCEG